MKKNSYIVVSIKENGKNYAYGLKVNNSNNIFSVLSGIKGIETANICDSKKECREIVEFWNECYKKNGTYLFDSPAF